MKRTVLLAFLTLILPACTADATGDARLDALAASATRLHFTASSDFMESPAPDVDVTVTDAAKVSALFEATLAQPTFPSEPENLCVTDGISYDLSFTSYLSSAGGSTTTEVTVYPDSYCQGIDVPGLDTQLQPDAAYWSKVASTIGVPESAIFPPPSSP